MADKGYTFASSEEAQQSVAQRFKDLTGIDATNDGGWGTDQADPDLIAGITEAEYTALHDDEIATATADSQCYVKAGQEDAYNAAYFDVETEYYATHKTEVDAYFAALDAAQKKD
jgi:hypothetical protein